MATFQVISQIADIPANDWQALLPGRYPFLHYAFLQALEDSRCMGDDSGWQPEYLLHQDHNGQTDWILPLFRKQHSYGEYVFDWSWADAYQHHGFRYYPKLLCAAPFTPATGPRLLYRHHDSAPPWQSAIQALQHHTRDQEMSGWHLNFPNASDLAELATLSESQGLLIRRACQFHWFNRQYSSFDHFLSFFTSRKRKSVRKERQRLSDMNIQLCRLTGEQLTPAAIKRFYRCYQLTYRKRGQQGYLNNAFFLQLAATMNQQMMLVEASHDGQHLASALYFFDDHTLYGRYWGCVKEIDGLHFEACYYQGIEFCLEQGLDHFDPGTQGEHKISRGFEPVITSSLHQLQHPDFQAAVANFIDQETPQILAYQQQAITLLPFRENAFDELPTTSHTSPPSPLSDNEQTPP
ncbi:GNAT family N-acetyltransferase [Oceanobacter sp. 3_MG-2023]|uniref:GNAT family N-acetyltransferase n=1 Tax=Oceanobacter sp. 3_MG-2023 TaxID=3062622 RepID=UPI002732A213|nr:GNAT family N-acetyltransferase [Oceanobacter sp. 3_MG-2023]MDP2504118.1 GNAT family N-acetyltransferase [Oceanobacter sp. 3_MG-2023]